MAEFNEIPNRETINASEKRVEAITTENTIDSARKAAFVLTSFGFERLKNKAFNELLFDKNDDAEVSKGSFGLPIFTNLEIQGGSYQFFNDETQRNEINSYSGLQLDTVLMTVTMSKNIITTQVQGRNGTVKEYTSDGDFEIDVRGVLIGDGQNNYPELEVEELVRLLTVPDTLTVTSDFLSRFSSISPAGIEGIDKVVVTDFSFPQKEGYRNAQLFQFKLLSNAPIQLTI